MEEYKVKETEFKYITDNATSIIAMAHTLSIAVDSDKIDTLYTKEVIDIMLGFAIDIANKVGEMEAGQ